MTSTEMRAAVWQRDDRNIQLEHCSLKQCHLSAAHTSMLMSSVEPLILPPPKDKRIIPQPRVMRHQKHEFGCVQLATEAQGATAQLVGILKAPGVFELPGTIAVVAFRAAAAIGTQRPNQLGRILPTLLTVASAAAKSGTHPPLGAHTR